MTVQQLSGTIVVIIIAVGVQLCIIFFVYAKRQLQRFNALRNRRGPHISVGHGAPKALRREADRLLEYVSYIRHEPPLQVDVTDPELKRDYRKQIIVNFQAFEGELADYSHHYIRPVGGNVRTHLVSCINGPLAGADTKLVNHVVDDYNAARHHYDPIDRQKLKVFIERLDRLRAVLRANQLVKPHPSPLPPQQALLPRSGSPGRKRKNAKTSSTSNKSEAAAGGNAPSSSSAGVGGAVVKKTGSRTASSAPLIVSSVVSLDSAGGGNPSAAGKQAIVV